MLVEVDFAGATLVEAAGGLGVAGLGLAVSGLDEARGAGELGDEGLHRAFVRNVMIGPDAGDDTGETRLLPYDLPVVTVQIVTRSDLSKHGDEPKSEERLIIGALGYREVGHRSPL